MDYSTIVGSYLLIFGNLEQTVDTSIQVIWKKHFGEPSSEIISKIIEKMNFYKRLEILQEIINHIGLSNSDISEWQKLFSSIKCLNEMRNTLAHGMYGIEKDRFIKLKKDCESKEIDDESLLKNQKELDERYRQLFDSVVVSAVIGEEKLIWISVFPKLKW